MSRFCGKLKRKSDCGIRMFQGVSFCIMVQLTYGKDVIFEKFFV